MGKGPLLSGRASSGCSADFRAHQLSLEERARGCARGRRARHAHRERRSTARRRFARAAACSIRIRICTACAACRGRRPVELAGDDRLEHVELGAELRVVHVIQLHRHREGAPALHGHGHKPCAGRRLRRFAGRKMPAVSHWSKHPLIKQGNHRGFAVVCSTTGGGQKPPRGYGVLVELVKRAPVVKRAPAVECAVGQTSCVRAHHALCNARQPRPSLPILRPRE